MLEDPSYSFFEFNNHGQRYDQLAFAFNIIYMFLFRYSKYNSKTIISLNVSFTKFMTFAKITSLHFNKSLSLAVGRQTKENKIDKNKYGIEEEVSIRV